MLGASAKKVLHISSYDHGGAGIAAYRLHRNLRANEFESRMLVLNKRENDDYVIAVGEESGLFGRMQRFASKAWFKVIGDDNYYFQDQCLTLIKSGNEIFDLVGFKPDVIVMHWVSGFISLEEVTKLAKHYDIPVFCYLLDMANLTGGCHYAWDCLGYTRQCGRCPAIGSNRDNDVSHKIWKAKYDSIQNVEVKVLAATEWADRQARASSLFGDRPVTKLMLSVDADTFNLADKAKTRETLGLPQDKKIIFFGNQGFGLKRKGLHLLMQALDILAADPQVNNDKVFVVSAGHPPKDFSLPLAHKPLGFLNGDMALARAYQAADMFVCPSIEDTGPMMINESVMCGTPVVSFDMGAAPDLVHPGISGYRAKLGDAQDLAAGIKSLLYQDDEQVESMRVKCREMAVALCHPQRQVEWFIQHLSEKSGAV